MSAAAVAIVNAAISRTGGNTFTGTDFGTGVSTDGVEKNLAYLNYETVAQAALAIAPWRFARKVAVCTLVGATPAGISDYAYKWTVPGDVLELRALTVAGQPVDYQDGGGGTIYTGTNTGVYAVYTYRADEAVWPQDFTEGIIRKLEAVYLLADGQSDLALARDKAGDAALDQARQMVRGTRTFAALSSVAIAIVNAAIARTTGNLIPVSDFTDGSREANLAATNYEQVVQREITTYPWQFARKSAACTLVGASPSGASEYAYQWTLPVDVLSLRSITVAGQPTDYQTGGAGTIFVRQNSGVFAVYSYRADESVWPADFKEGITRRLEALYLRTAPEGAKEAELRDKAADEAFDQARAQTRGARSAASLSAAAIAIVNAAIGRTVGNTIPETDFTDGSREANLAATNYEQVVTRELATYPWQFARKTAVCTLVGATPSGESDYGYKWTLPNDVIHLRNLTVAGVSVDYQAGGGVTVYTNQSASLFAAYTYRAAESVWPADFTEGVTRRLEALYLRSTDAADKAALRDRAADQAFDSARLLIRGTRTLASLSTAALAIINAAIARTTGNTLNVTDFSDGSREASLAAQNYEQTVATTLEQAPWRFARKTAVCTLVVDGGGTPVAPVDTSWKYSWTLPNDVLILRTLMRNGCVIPYEIDQSGVVLTNYLDSVYAIYTYRAAESIWPSDFKEGITRRLEALLLRAQASSPTVAEIATDGSQQVSRPPGSALADSRDLAAEDILARAKIAHAQEEYPTDPRRRPRLIAARRTGYGSCPR